MEEEQLSDSSMDDRQTVGVDTAVEGDIYMEVEGALASKENAEDWRRAIDKVVPAVVVLRITVPRAFDTRAPGSFHATGFVVDKRLGIILTNRHVARNFQFQCGLVYVAEPGYMFYRAGVPRHAIIKKFAGVEIAVLEDLITTLSKLHRGACIPLEYVNYKNRHHRKSALVTIDHHEWYTAPQVYTRNDSDGLWTAKPAFEPLPLLLTRHVSKIQRVTGKQTLPCSGDPNSVEHIPQERIQELINGVKSIGICEGHSFDTHGQGELDTRKNRLSIKEDSSTDGALADYSLLDDIVVEIGDRRDVENVADMTDCHGKISHSANASYAEHVIEPTLVMVENYDIANAGLHPVNCDYCLNLMRNWSSWSMLSGTYSTIYHGRWHSFKKHFWNWRYCTSLPRHGTGCSRQKHSPCIYV
ncbi:hypothetical protein SAY86_030818 [Trapa natans]|uniref:Serine protease n=1 Tax=Trapa natans TaxID=22666 RepID=A0AAN7M5K9_TRANT|nr:hypothetical protein SAY86_030818 [Trapa natans]